MQIIDAMKLLSRQKQGISVTHVGHWHVAILRVGNQANSFAASAYLALLLRQCEGMTGHW